MSACNISGACPDNADDWNRANNRRSPTLLRERETVILLLGKTISALLLQSVTIVFNKSASLGFKLTELLHQTALNGKVVYVNWFTVFCVKTAYAVSSCSWCFSTMSWERCGYGKSFYRPIKGMQVSKHQFLEWPINNETLLQRPL